MGTYIVAVTGASGSLYAKTLLEFFRDNNHIVYLTITAPGLRVLENELGWSLAGTEKEIEASLRVLLGFPAGDSLRYFDNHDIGALIASGSVKTDGMIVIPCTMSTVSGIAHGTAKNLAERAADIMLKENRPLILVPRETPLNQVHLQNLLTLAQMGVKIVPAMPAFYHQPQTIQDMVNFIVGRVLDLLGIENDLYQRWLG